MCIKLIECSIKFAIEQTANDDFKVPGVSKMIEMIKEELYPNGNFPNTNTYYTFTIGKGDPCYTCSVELSKELDIYARYKHLIFAQVCNTIFYNAELQLYDTIGLIEKYKVPINKVVKCIMDIESQLHWNPCLGVFTVHWMKAYYLTLSILQGNYNAMQKFWGEEGNGTTEMIKRFAIEGNKEYLRLMVPTDVEVDLSEFIPQGYKWVTSPLISPIISHVVVYNKIKSGDMYVLFDTYDEKIYSIYPFDEDNSIEGNLIDNDLIMESSKETTWMPALIKLDQPIIFDYFVSRQVYSIDDNFYVQLTKYNSHGVKYVGSCHYHIYTKFNPNTNKFKFSHSDTNDETILFVLVQIPIDMKRQDSISTSKCNHTEEVDEELKFRAQASGQTKRYMNLLKPPEDEDQTKTNENTETKKKQINLSKFLLMMHMMMNSKGE